MRLGLSMIISIVILIKVLSFKMKYLDGSFVGGDFRGFDRSCISIIRKNLLTGVAVEFKKIKCFETNNFERSAKKIAKKNYLLDYMNFAFQSGDPETDSWVDGLLYFYRNGNSFSYSYLAPTIEFENRLRFVFDEIIDLVVNNNLGYGYRFSNLDTNNPMGYPFGQGRARVHTETSGQLLKYWSSAIAFPNEQAPFRHGVLREIYEVNYLNSSHLSAQVGNVSFEDWVSKSSRFGTLEMLSKNVWKWSVFRHDIEFVRQRLSGSKLLSLPRFVDDFYKLKA
jgi:hypothetical protein